MRYGSDCDYLLNYINQETVSLNSTFYKWAIYSTVMEISCRISAL